MTPSLRAYWKERTNMPFCCLRTHTPLFIAKRQQSVYVACRVQTIWREMNRPDSCLKCRLLPVSRIYVYLNMSRRCCYPVIVFAALEECLFRNLRRSVSIRRNVCLKCDWIGREMMSVIGTLGVIRVARRPYLMTLFGWDVKSLNRPKKNVMVHRDNDVWVVIDSRLCHLTFSQGFWCRWPRYGILRIILPLP